MDIEYLHQKIKEECRKRGITISQLEKELGFSVGSIGKWSQSAPSIEKVVAVADFFGLSVDELCGIKKTKDDMQFVEKMIQKTIEGGLAWYSCSEDEILHFRFSTIEDLIKPYQIYVAPYDVGNFLLLSDENQRKRLYINISESAYYKQDAGDGLLDELFTAIEEREEEIKSQIEKFKQQFISE
ncbi:MAG: helix-turn-helix domain-containing protein [Lachnospiraceae bacterium]|nr:helix-turn-helix domain-containing protein [Lachnospiraceae bacterium]